MTSGEKKIPGFNDPQYAPSLYMINTNTEQTDLHKLYKLHKPEYINL